MMDKNEKFGLAVLLFISLLLSVYLFFRTYIISLDGAFQYIPIAKDFASGNFRKALSHNQQPLYPFIIAFASRWASDFEWMGKLISSFFGILIIFPVYFLGRRIFDEKIALLSTFLLTIHPYLRRFSADVLKESTYLFFFATAIWFAWRTIQEEKKYPFLFIPLFSALAYLVRPDGIEILLVAFFYVLFIKKFDVSGSRRTVVLLLLISSFILSLPYLFYLREVRGEWALSKAKSIGGILGLEVIRDGITLSQKIFYSFKRLNSEIIGRFHPIYITLFMIGLLRSISSRLKSGEGFLLSLGCFHYVILFLMVLNTTQWGEDKTVRVDELSGRHVFPLLLVSIYWVGEGLMIIYRWVYKKLEFTHFLDRFGARRKSIIMMALLLVLISAVVLPKTLKPQRYERLSERWAGNWIKNQFGKGVTIFTNIPQVAFYADGSLQYVDLRESTVDKIKASMIEKKAFYLVVREKDVVDRAQEAKSIEKDFAEIVRFEKGGIEKIIVYKLKRAQSMD